MGTCSSSIDGCGMAGGAGPACQRGCAEGAMLMACEREDEVGEEVMASCKLLRASAEGSLEGIREALAQGAELETRTSNHIIFPIKSEEDVAGDVFPVVPEEMRSGLGPLMLAAKEGWPEAVRLLLACRASPHSRDEDGSAESGEGRAQDGLRALHFAALAGCRDSCWVLLEAGAMAEAEDDAGRDAYAYLPPECTAGLRNRLAWQALLRPAAALAMRKTRRPRSEVATPGLEAVALEALQSSQGAGGL